MSPTTKMAFGQVLALILCGLAAYPLRAQTAVEERSSLPPEVARNYLVRLREFCLRDKLRGVRVADCWLIKGSLVISGLVDHEEQLKLLEDEAGAQIAATPQLRSLVTAGVSLERVTVAPLRSQSLAQLQTAFATQRFADDHWETTLRQTRLDDAVFDKAGGLVLRGVCISDAARAAMTGDSAKPDLPIYRMIIQIEDLLQQQLTPGIYRKLNLNDNRVEIEFLPNPMVGLQLAIASRPELDGTLVRGVTFDERGVLKLEGLIASNEQRMALATFLEAHLADSQVWRSPAEATDAVAGLAKFPLEDWRKGLQRALAESDEDAWQKTLVTRAWFHSDGQVAVQLSSLGIEADEDYQLGFEKLALATTARLAADQPAIGLQIRKVLVGTADMWTDPVQDLRAVTARQPQFDGLRVDTAVFDATGKLTLRGLCNDTEQAEEFAAFATGTLKSARSPLAALPISCATMKELPIKNVLKDLRVWSSQTLDEVWLERLYFGADGRLQLHGTSIAEADEAKCRQQALELAVRHPVAKWLPEADPLETKFTVVSPGLTELLRKFAADSNALRGLSIQRGYYDVEGEYLISGVQDEAQQVVLLNKLVGELSADTPLRMRLPAGLKADKFVIAPMSQLVVCLNDVMPAFNTFDGIQLTEAFHDEQNRLAFRGKSTTRNLEEAQNALIGLLKADPEWGVRVGAGVSLKSLTMIPLSDPDDVRKEVTSAVPLVREAKYAEAIAQLGELLQRNPNDSLAWYLRGICHESQNRLELARRDYLRVHAIDQTDRSAVFDRARRLEGLQGTMREKADKQMKRVAAEIAGGKSINSLFGVQAWRAVNAK